MIRHASTYFLKVGVLLTGLISSAAGAANFTVTNLNDSGPGSLRQAIADANRTPGADIITFSVSDTITLSSTLPEITDTTGGLTIDGTGNSITVSGGGRVIIVSSGATLNLEHLTVVHGTVPPEDIYGGGGLLNRGGTVTVSNSTFSGNYSAGGIGSVTSFSGGGIYNNGTLTVTNSTFSGNYAYAYGGGIYNNGTLTVTNSTFSGNSATPGDGGGIYNNGTLTVTK